MTPRLRLAVAGSVLLALAAVTASAPAADPTPLRVNAFPGLGNLAIFVGQANGVFAKHGLKIDLQFTPNSTLQREGLAKGAFEIAHTAADNAVAMVENAGADVIIVMGGDSSLNQLFVQPEITSVADLRGKIAVVDAPNTAFALQLKKVLLMHGLVAGRDYTVKPAGGTITRLKLMQENKENAAAMLNPPFAILAEQAGLRSLGLAVKLIGPYQAGSAVVLRSWAKGHSDTLERYIKAYVESLRWTLSPANRAEAAALLAGRLKIPPEVAAKAYALAADPVGGFARDAKFDTGGFKNVLALRAEIEGQWGGKPPAPDKYVDLSYYDRALAALGK